MLHTLYLTGYSRGILHHVHVPSPTEWNINMAYDITFHVNIPNNIRKITSPINVIYIIMYILFLLPATYSNGNGCIVIH